MGFLWGLMIFSLVYYFLLPIGAAYFQDLYKIKVWGPVNVGILFALSRVRRRLGARLLSTRDRANAVFDPMAAEIVRDAEKTHGRPQMNSPSTSHSSPARVALAAIATPGARAGRRRRASAAG